MWVCPECKRQFKKTKQPHSCRKVLLAKHFKDKEKAKKIFDYFVAQINNDVGKCKIISLPCSIHLFSNYDFLAAFPKKEELEIRFILNRKLDSPRLKQSVKMSSIVFKDVFYFNSEKEIDNEFIGWLRESYHLRSN